MHHGNLFVQAFIYLLATVISVPLAKRIGLSSIIGYLLAGVVIGPYVLDFVGKDNTNVMQFSEFGIVMMLFLIGLELRPSLLWQLRTQIFGMGLLQVLGTTVLIMLIGVLLGVKLTTALTVGMIVSLSSTAIVMQMLFESGRLKLDVGKTTFAILLFQDIAVIPMLAILPLLAMESTKAITAEQASLTTVTGWQKALFLIVTIFALVIASRYLLRPILRFIAKAKLREMFTAVALLIVIGISLGMHYEGLSPALGAFIAGVVLAENEYRHELESDIEPFKGLLLGLFFISVGAGINFDILFKQPWLIVGLLLILTSTKFIALAGIGRVFKLAWADNLLMALALAQGGEFCFVLFSYALQNHILSSDIVNLLMVVVALSMLLAPLLVMLYEKIIEPRFHVVEEVRPQDSIEDEESPVIIAGFGRFGQIAARLLMANHIKTTILDLDPDHVDLVRSYGFKVFYGDIARLDLLRAAKLESAKLFILAIEDSDKALEVAEMVRKYNPHIKILIRVKGRTQAYEFLRHGFDALYRETFDTSLAMGVDALRELGFSPQQAERAGQLFKQHDEASMRHLVQFYDDRNAYIHEMHKVRQSLEEVLAADHAMGLTPNATQEIHSR